MSDEIPRPPYIYEGADPMSNGEISSPGISETVSRTVDRVSEALESAKRPGMPLSILSNVAREAPLGSLLAAFLLGVAVARRR